MSTEPINPHDDFPPRPGMSGTSKTLLGLGIGCGVLVLLCCGVFGAGSFFVAKMAENAISNDPAQVHATTSEIVSITLPDSLQPEMSMDLTLPVFKQKLMTWVAYTDVAKEGGVFLVQFSLGAASGDMLEQWKKSMREQGKSNFGENVQLDESEQFETTVNGQPAEFTLGKGHDKKMNKEVWQATGPFAGKGGQAMLILNLSAEQYSKDQVLDILKSMK